MEPARHTKIVAIDPGIGQTGWAALVWDRETGVTHVLATGMFRGDELFRKRKEMKGLFSKAFCTLDAYEEAFLELLQSYVPDHVVCEGAFYHKFVQTLISLTLMTHTLRKACSLVMGRDVHIVAPMKTKKAVTGNSMADKDLIKVSLLKNNKVVFEDKDHDPDKLTEHEYDAIAHGLCFIQTVLLV